MRYLGIDYGRKRVGIAVSDEEEWVAFPREVVSFRNRRLLLNHLTEIARAEGVSTIVVGLPVLPGGSEKDMAREVRRFAKEMEKSLSLPVEFENELLTTRLAESSGGAKNTQDASAAALILQSFLDKKRIQNERS